MSLILNFLTEAGGDSLPQPPNWGSLSDVFGAWMKPFFIAISVCAGILSVGTLIKVGWRFKNATNAQERKECWEGLIGWAMGLAIVCLSFSIVSIIVSVVKVKT